MYMRALRLIIGFIIILGLFFPAHVFCETVTLKSGKKIEGKILERTDQYIKIELDGSPVYYELKYIKSIEENKAPVILAPEGLSLGDSDAYLKKGLGYGSEAKFAEARQEFKKGLEIAPSDHNLQEALKVLDDIDKGIIKQEYALYLFKGSHYLMDAQYGQAIPEFKEALRINPEDFDIYYYLGVCNYKLEQYEEAITYLKIALEKKSDAELYYYLGVCHYSLGQFPEAITYLEKTLQIYPDDADAYSVIGTSYYLLGQSRQAKESLSKAQDLFKKEGDYLKAKDIEEFLDKLNNP